MTQRQPAASGTLAARPLSHLLVYLLDRKLTGTLVLQPPGDKAVKSAVFFRDGIPCRVKTADPVVHLGRLLLEQGSIDDATLNQSLAKWAQSGGLHGKVLVDDGVISQEALDDALVEQGARKLGWLFSLPAESRFGFYLDEDLLPGYSGPEGFPVNPLAGLWLGVRQYPDAARIRATLERIQGQVLRLHVDAQPGAFSFKRDARAVLDVLRAAPCTLDELVRASLLSPLVLERLVYVLVVSRQLDLGVGAPARITPSVGAPALDHTPEPAPLSSSARPGAIPDAESSLLPSVSARSSTSLLPSVSTSRMPKVSTGASTSRMPKVSTGASTSRMPKVSTGASTSRMPKVSTGVSTSGMPKVSVPPGSSRRPPSGRSRVMPAVGDPSPELVAELEARAEQAASQTYYEILGVQRDCTKAEVQTAFLALAKDWHPDRLVPVVGEHRELAAKLFSRISEAHQVLSDEQRRTEYASKLEGKEEDSHERELVERVLRATTHFQKAEVLLRRHDPLGALEHSRLAMENDPDQVDYIALHAWVESHDPLRIEAERYDDLIATLTTALKRQENHKKARHYRAHLCKRAGRIRESIRDFRWLAENDRSNVEARREIRLYEMRRKSKGDSSMRPGAKRSKSGSPGAKRSKSGSPDVGEFFGKLLKRRSD